jgi:RNA polymerase sigma-70 factor (ECF subfamily)
LSPVAATPALDERELTQIHRRYRHLILRRCRRILRDSHSAEDVTQTVFIKLWRYGESFRRAAAPLWWLYRVADRCCFDELRRRIPSGGDEAIDEKVAARVADSVEDRELLLRFLRRFDGRVQRIAVLRFCEEMSQDEIAAETCWSRQTVHKKLQLVRKCALVWRLRLFGSSR